MGASRSLNGASELADFRGKAEVYVFVHKLALFDLTGPVLAEPGDHFLDELFGNGGAGGEDDGLYAFEPLLSNVRRGAY